MKFSVGMSARKPRLRHAANLTLQGQTLQHTGYLANSCIFCFHWSAVQLPVTEQRRSSQVSTTVLHRPCIQTCQSIPGEHPCACIALLVQNNLHLKSLIPKPVAHLHVLPEKMLSRFSLVLPCRVLSTNCGAEMTNGTARGQLRKQNTLVTGPIQISSHLASVSHICKTRVILNCLRILQALIN